MRHASMAISRSRIHCGPDAGSLAVSVNCTCSRSDPYSSRPGRSRAESRVGLRISAERSASFRQLHFFARHRSEEPERMARSQPLAPIRSLGRVEIVGVVPGSPADAAGLRGARPGLLRTTFLMTGLLAAGL